MSDTPADAADSAPADVPEEIAETTDVPDEISAPEALDDAVPDVPEEIPVDPLPPADPAPSDEDLITIHPGAESPEVLPNPETEPMTIPNPEGGLNPPEGWTPGGPEGGF